MTYNTLFLDIDGTMVGTDESPVGHDPRLQGLLQEFMGNEGEVSLVTGRSTEYTSAIHDTFGLNGGRIVEKGAAVILPDNREIKIGALEDKSEIREFLRDKGALDCMVLEPKKYMLSLVLPEFPHHDVAELRRAYDNLRPQFEAQGFEKAEITVDDYSIDIENPDANKGEGIKRYAAETERDLANAMIVGDSRGDLPGFKAVAEKGGLVVYVGNDSTFGDELRRLFDDVWVSDKKRSTGLCDILEGGG